MKMVGSRVTGELIYDNDEFPMFSKDAEYLKEKTEEAVKSFGY
jgi:hypothetical protein